MNFIKNIILIVYSFFFINLAYINLIDMRNIKDVRIYEIYDNKNQFVTSINNITNSTYIEFEDIPVIIPKYFVGFEDKGFYKHNGVKTSSIIRSFFINISNRKNKQGASTITQQLSRGLHLENEKTLKRKIKEVNLAIAYETKYTKEEILELYLNTLYFGNSIYGITDASSFYFGKSLEEINLKEISLLIGIINAPSYYDPTSNLDKCLRRSKLVLDKLYIDSIITLEEYSDALKSDIDIIGYKNSNSYRASYHYSLKAINEFNTLNIDNKSVKKIKLMTAYNSNIGNFIYKEINSNTIQSSLIFLDNTNGLYEYYIGSNNIDKSRFDRASHSNRMVGSLIKPFLYFSAISNNVSPTTYLYSRNTNFYIDDTVYEPSNYLHLYENDKISMTYALSTSDNIYAVKLLSHIGTKKFNKTLNDFGLFPSELNLTSSLGTNTHTILELANAYGILANNGFKKKYNFNRQIEIDNKVYILKSAEAKVVDSDTAFIINDMLTNCYNTKINSTNDVTCSSISEIINKRVSTKTGSTDFDNYIVGYNKSNLFIVWSGFDNNIKVDNIANQTNKELFIKVINDHFIDEQYKIPSTLSPIYIKPTYKFKEENLKIYIKKH